MNRLLTYEGGQPLTTGDFGFLQDCYTEVIESLMQGVTNGIDCVLYGIESEKDGLVPGYVTKGAVCIGREVLTVAEELSVSGARYLCFRQVQSEAREFKDSQTHKVYLRHEAYLTNNAEGAYKFIEIAKAKRLADILNGEVLWNVSEIRTLATGVTGSIEERLMKGKYEMRISLSKSTSVDNVLYKFPTTRLSETYTGIAVDELSNKAVILIDDVTGTCRLYHVDGTECIDRVVLRNVILK